MSDCDDDFFSGKRPWSLIKDQVLETYMSPYMAKVKKLNRVILLIDGYAGPGTFEDGKPGSPLIICKAAERFAKGNYQAIFLNKCEAHHGKLESILQRHGWLGPARPILGDSTQLLHLIPNLLKDQTVFLYLDPFGPTGCEFALLEPFLRRNPRLSTEIVLTMNMPVMHRLAARHAVREGRQDAQRIISTYHQTLTKVFGGDYWKDILWEENASPEAREVRLIEAYRAKIGEYFAFTGYCPVRERVDKPIKYFVVFASHHPDTMTLMNDAMAKAYFGEMHKASYGDTMFKDTDWREWRSIEDLNQVILSTVAEHSQRTRKDIWTHIVRRHFMRYVATEYKEAVRLLVEEKKLAFRSRTNRLNDDCTLYIP